MRTLALFICIIATSRVFACDCMTHDKFALASLESDFVGKVRVQAKKLDTLTDYFFYLELEVLEIYKGHDTRETIRLRAGSSSQCVNPLKSYKKDSIYIFAINLIGSRPMRHYEVPGEYYMDLCGQFSLSYDAFNDEAYHNNVRDPERYSISELRKFYENEPEYWVVNHNLSAPINAVYAGLENTIEIHAERRPKRYKLKCDDLELTQLVAESRQVYSATSNGKIGETTLYIYNTSDELIDSLEYRIEPKPSLFIYVGSQRSNGIFERNSSSFRVSYPKYVPYPSSVQLEKYTLTVGDVTFEGTEFFFTPEMKKQIANSYMSTDIIIECEIIDAKGNEQSLKATLYLSM